MVTRNGEQQSLSLPSDALSGSEHENLSHSSRPLQRKMHLSTVQPPQFFRSSKMCDIVQCPLQRGCPYFGVALIGYATELTEIIPSPLPMIKQFSSAQCTALGIENILEWYTQVSRPSHQPTDGMKCKAFVEHEKSKSGQSVATKYTICWQVLCDISPQYDLQKK